MKKDYVIFLMRCLLLISPIIFGKVELLGQTIKKGSYLIYTGDNTAMQVLWQMAALSSDTIKWGTDQTYSSGSAPSNEYGTDHQHKYTITNLMPGTKYYYQVKINNAATYNGSFHTAPSADETAIKFLAYGDTRSNQEVHNQVADSMISAYNRDGGYQTFILSVGDLVADGTQESNWTGEFFNRSYTNIQEMIANVPYQSCIGNHEGNGILFQKYFPYPYVSSRYWSFDYGPAHFAVVDQYTSYIPGSSQYQWLDNDLASTTRTWKFICLHEPGWSAAGGHSNNANVQQYIEPLCEKYHIPIVFGGHNHYYARARVIGTNGDTVQHITTGGGGAPPYTPVLTQPNIVAGVQAYHFCKVNIIDNNTLQFEAVSTSGTVIDQFTIIRTPLLISSVQVVSITTSSAVINWSTDKASNSIVEYGLTTIYGNTAIGSAGITNHNVAVSGLMSNTVYHYRVKSENATSDDYTFRTSEEPMINVTFQVNMAVKMALQAFIPDSGDVVTVRGSFNDWGESTGNPDTLTDANHDSIYTKVIQIHARQMISFKFGKTLRGGMDYESIVRSHTLGANDTIFQLVYFNNDSIIPSVTFSVATRWNLVSVPLKAINSIKTFLFPTATSVAWEYNLEYVQSDTLKNGKGYWMKFSNLQDINLIGLLYSGDTIEVAKGWNLIGSISEPVTTVSIISDPPRISTGSFFGYKNGYVNADTIFPGKGYWAKVNQAGKLILSASTPLVSSSRIKIIPNNEMPPTPPDETTSAIKEVPNDFALEQAYPSPFNPSTTIKYQLPVDSKVTLKVYNLLGQVVAILADEVQSVGYRSVEWNGSNQTSGVYFYRLEATSINNPNKSFTQVKKMLLLR